MLKKLKYGGTNTYFTGGLLIDTDYAGTLPAFYKALKQNDITVPDIKYVIATHYHPDHIGLISKLVEFGAKLLLLEHQVKYVHYADAIFAREPWLKYNPIDEGKAVVLGCDKSRQFLSGIGIQGEAVPTTSHSGDGIAVVFDNGDCCVGDLEPASFIEAYENNMALQKDWERIMSFHPATIYYGHANMQKLR